MWLPTDKERPDESLFQELIARTNDALENDNSDFAEIVQRDRIWSPTIDHPRECDQDEEEDDVRERREAYITSPYFQTMTHEEQVTADRVLTTDELRWQARFQLVHDGLLPFDDDFPPYKAPDYTIRAGQLSRYVLSGMVGAHLLTRNKELDAIAAKIEEQRLARAILVGGACITADAGYVSLFDRSTLYKSQGADEIEHTTHLGADIHGDFRMLRYSRFRGEVRDSATGLSHYFAPAFDYIPLGAYHSQEPNITEALLGYLLTHKQVQPSSLRKRLMSRIIEIDSHIHSRHGAFGDFDDADGVRQGTTITDIVHKVKDYEPRETLARLPILPQHEQMLELTAVQGGVRFSNGDESFTLPDQEIEEYIVALACAVGGRTTPRAHLTIIDSLSGKVPSRDGIAINPLNTKGF